MRGVYDKYITMGRLILTFTVEFCPGVPAYTTTYIRIVDRGRQVFKFAACRLSFSSNRGVCIHHASDIYLRLTLVTTSLTVMPQIFGL